MGVMCIDYRIGLHWYVLFSDLELAVCDALAVRSSAR